MASFDGLRLPYKYSTNCSNVYPPGPGVLRKYYTLLLREASISRRVGNNLLPRNNPRGTFALVPAMEWCDDVYRVDLKMGRSR